MNQLTKQRSFPLAYRPPLHRGAQAATSRPGSLSSSITGDGERSGRLVLFAPMAGEMKTAGKEEGWRAIFAMASFSASFIYPAYSSISG